MSDDKMPGEGQLSPKHAHVISLVFLWLALAGLWKTVEVVVTTLSMIGRLFH